jgi:hypothetical protein
LVNFMSSRPNLLARMVFAVTRRRPLQASAPVPVPLRAALRVPLTADAQWARLNAVVVGSTDRALGISLQHAQARDQLDAAAYALHLLLAELGTVMQLPVRAMLPGTSATDEPDLALAA